MKWAAIVLFSTTADCDAFVEAHDLQAEHSVQCVLIEPDYSHLDKIRRPAARPLAPPIRPRPRPAQGASE